MKKIVVIALIVLGAMSAVSCKNSSKSEEAAATVDTEVVATETCDSAAAVEEVVDSTVVNVKNAAE